MTTPLDFEELVARHQGAVCAIAYAVLRDRARSEEVAQEAFLVAWQKLPGMVPAPSLPGWVCGIARNLARNAARRRRETTMTDEPATTAADPLDHILAREQAGLAERALATLSETEREAIVLYYRGDESLGAVAAALGISEAAAKKRVLRGRAHLREAGREVEATLQRTRPTAAFTAGCVAALAAGSGAKASATTLGRSASDASGSVGSKLALGGVIAAIATTTAVWATRRDPAPAIPRAPTPVVVQSIDPGIVQPIDLAARHALATRIAEARARRLATTQMTAPIAATQPDPLPEIDRVRTYDFAGGALADPIPSAAATPLTSPPAPNMISKRELREAIRLVQPFVRDCYDRDGRGAHGTLQLVVRIEGEPGTGMIATDARVDGEFSTNAELAECVKQSLLSIEMPPLDVGGIYDINYRFTI